MSGFRKFRTSSHRRRRSIEAIELGYLKAGSTPANGGITPQPGDPATAADFVSPVKDGALTGHHRGAAAEPARTVTEMSPSAEALEIGPAPIAWLKPRRPQTDH